MGRTASTPTCRRLSVESAASGLLATVLLALLACAPASRARAQDDEAPSAAQREGAAEAFDRGTAAFLAREYERAAVWFETANRLAPAASALVQAIRAHERARNGLRAATLAIRLKDQFADVASAQRVASRTLESARTRYFRVDVVCTDCTIDLDGTLQDYPSFFLEPETPHGIVAHFETGERRESVTGAAGEQRSLELEAPPPQVQTPAPSAEAGRSGQPGRGGRARRRAGRHRSNGMSPVVAVVGTVLTAAVGGIATWSGLDTLSGVDAYEAMPTQAGLEDGQSKEFRTNLLITATAALGAATLILAIFATDWSGEDDQEARAAHARVGIAPTSGGAAGVVQGRF